MPKKKTIQQVEGITGYKAFDMDLKCKGLQYGIGKTMEIDGEIILCEHGLHFCLKCNDCFEYYSFDPKSTRICEVIAENVSTETNNDDSKRVCSKLTIVRELNWMEVLERINTGKADTGRANSGHLNSGHHNSGHHNSGKYHVGSFNSEDLKTVMLFNKPISIFNYQQISFPCWFYFDLCVWVSYNQMTDQEKADHPKADVSEGYLKTLDYKEAWRLAYEKASEEERQLVWAIPNFDPVVFETITGIKMTKKETDQDV